MRLLILVFCVVVFHPLVHGQSDTLKGFLKSGDQPLQGATVRLNKQQAITDSAGYFVFAGISAGTYLLHASMVGYHPYSKNIAVQKGFQNVTIELQPAQDDMEEVVVTGTLKPVQRLQSPIAVEVYNAHFFAKNPAPSLFESLQSVNGVRPQINCSVCNTGDIHMNGLEGPYTMVTIDGMPIVSSLASVYGLFGIPSQMIEKVEIVKGPASGLYGSEAIGGLINIITKSPEKAPLFSANVMATSWQEYSADLGLKIKASKKSSSLLGINYYYFQKPFDKNGDNFTDVTLQHRISVFNKWNWQRNNNRTATLAARLFTEDRWGGELQWNKNFKGSREVYGESIATGRAELIGKYQLPVLEKMFLSFSATIHDQNSFYGNVPYTGLQKIAFVQYTWNKQIGVQHDLLAGMATRYNFYDDNSTATIDTLTKHNQPDEVIIPGFFVQDEWTWSDKQTMLLGLRIDHHKAHGNIITPRVAHRFKINDKQIMRLNAGTGFRVVNLFTEDHAALTGARAVVIKEKLKPEKSYNASINYALQWGSRSASFNIDAAAWVTYFTNQIIADYDVNPNAIYYDNLNGHSISKGITTNLDFNFWQRLKGNVGVTFQNVAKKEKTNSGVTKAVQPKLTEQWSSTWNITYSMPLAGLTLDYTGNVYGPMHLPLASALDPRPATSPVWSIQNIQVTKTINQNFELYGGVKNLLNWTPAKSAPFIIARAHDPFDKKVEYDSNGSVVPTAENPYALTFDPTYVYAPNQGLRLFVGIKYKVK